MKLSEEFLNGMINDPKKRMFIGHLVNAYLPIHKSHNAWDSVPDKSCECCFCRQHLFTAADFIRITKNTSSKLLDYFKACIEDTPMEHPVLSYFKGKKRAITGEETTTLMCEDCFKTFINWAFDQILRGDGYLNWTVNQMKKKEIIIAVDRFVEKNPDKISTEKVNIAKKTINKYPKANQTLAENQALKELYEKMLQAEPS